MHQYHQLLRGFQGEVEAMAKLHEEYLNKILPPEEFIQDRFIFCSLNHHVKLSRQDIECWNEILKQVKDSVLVLFLMFSHEPQKNLLQHFDEEVRNRIYFVGAAPKWIHLHRLQAMDCILDSFYYGAHTSAGDAIWAQVPVVTRLGEAMESRVCSSMLHAAGLEELISHHVEDYIHCAVKCATDSQFYESCLQKLKQARQSPLFDRGSYIRHLGLGYQQAWEKFCDGNPSDHIVLKQ
jgi:predicted O-linked N-acetylglucosamine transferase (SPINDLY family)